MLSAPLPPVAAPDPVSQNPGARTDRVTADCFAGPRAATLTAVAMSGGVDSSVVAALLRERGDDVVGLTMQLWNQRRLPELRSVSGVSPVRATGAESPKTSAGHRCCSLDDVYDARRVAQHLGFPYYVVNYEEEFEDAVIRPFVREYLRGRTPIPCTLCNNH